MSHGTAGTLKCQDDNGYIVFNDVLLEFTRKVAKDVPMVSGPAVEVWGETQMSQSELCIILKAKQSQSYILLVEMYNFEFIQQIQ